MGTNLPGATNITLTLSDITVNQAGSYSVLVTNNSGSDGERGHDGSCGTGNFHQSAVEPIRPGRIFHQAHRKGGWSRPPKLSIALNGNNIAGATNRALVFPNLMLD